MKKTGLHGLQSGQALATMDYEQRISESATWLQHSLQNRMVLQVLTGQMGWICLVFPPTTAHYQSIINLTVFFKFPEAICPFTATIRSNTKISLSGCFRFQSTTCGKSRWNVLRSAERSLWTDPGYWRCKQENQTTLKHQSLHVVLINEKKHQTMDEGQN